MQAATGRFVALLNNDTEVDPGWAAAVVDAFERHPEAGFVASKMRLFDQRDHLHTAGDLYRMDGRLANRGVWEKDKGQYDREEYVFSACGGSSAYRRTMLDEIGLLDDDFFFSCEDMDLAWRAQLAGYRCVYTPNALVYHHLAATGGGVTASFYDGRNMIWILIKDYPAALWRKHAVKILRAQLDLAWEALRAWRGAAARARLRGMVAGCAEFRKCCANAAHSAESPCINSISGINPDAGSGSAAINPKVTQRWSTIIRLPTVRIFPSSSRPITKKRVCREACAQLRTLPPPQPYPVEVIIVDNNSRDRTGEIIAEFADEFPFMRGLSESTQGKGAAVRAGMLAARGEYRFICDADLSMPIEEMNKFLPPQTDGYDIAIGSREAPRRSALQRTLVSASDGPRI